MKPAPAPERAWPLFWAGLAGAVVVALIGMFGAHSGAVWGVERTLKSRVERALSAADVRNLSIAMEGQAVRLAGAAPNEAAHEAIVRAALTAAGPGGAWAGGVTEVNADDLIIGAPVSPYAWRASRRGAEVVLSGHAPTTRAKRRLAD
ncbi:MAG: BON domain-containing protein, partial [Hyphomonadaceae bacterium]